MWSSRHLSIFGLKFQFKVRKCSIFSKFMGALCSILKWICVSTILCVWHVYEYIMFCFKPTNICNQ